MPRLADRGCVDPLDLADVTDVDRVSIGIPGEPTGAEHFESGDGNGTAQLALHDFAYLEIDFLVEGFADNLDGGCIGHAEALLEACLQPRPVHGTGDRFAAAVDDHNMDADCREEGEVGSDLGPHLGIGIVHEAASIFYNEDRAAKPLNVGQRFEKNFCFGSDVELADVHLFALIEIYVALGQVGSQKPERTFSHIEIESDGEFAV